MEITEKITHWWNSNPMSRYGSVDISRSGKGDDAELILRFGNSFAVDLFDLRVLVGDKYRVTGRDVDVDYNAVIYNVKKV
jgi:hypothetical protein|tara:strand:- start:5939 stop:6178 length:240 start_codon:yes stop_codon:yes gene_type:complete